MLEVVCGFHEVFGIKGVFALQRERFGGEFGIDAITVDGLVRCLRAELSETSNRLKTLGSLPAEVSQPVEALGVCDVSGLLMPYVRPCCAENSCELLREARGV